MKKRTRLNVLHWPSAYTEPDFGKPYDNIFVKEHIASVQQYTHSKVLYISNENCQKGWFQKTRRLEDDIDTIRLYFSKKLPLAFLNIFIRIVILRELLLLWLKEDFRPQVIHIHFYQSALWAIAFARLLKAKLVITEHWTAFIGYPVISNQRFKDAAKAFTFANAVLPVSQPLALGIRNQTGVNIHMKDTIIHNSVDTSVFQYKMHKPNSIPQLLFVGRLDAQKNIPMLIRVVAYLNKQQITSYLTIIGGGDSILLKQLAHELGIAHLVSFKGSQSKETIASFMQQSDVLVLSSIAENSPCVIGEALCCGLPVISTQVGGIMELVDDSNGCLVEDFDIQTYAEVLQHMLHKNWDKASIAKEASLRFSREAIGKQIYNAYMA
jgi:glycosyltransferase involved in cell wall biosynthesis